jgi:hypothetical protein
LVVPLDPDLFPRTGDRAEVTRERVEQFLELLRSAIGAR